jgi:hypothetical protein
MQPRLLVKLPEGWTDVSAQLPEAGAMFIKGGKGATAALQVSYGLNPDAPAEGEELMEEDLVEMAATADFGEDLGQVVEKYSGPSLFGKMGTAVYRGGKYQRVQVWFLSNGRDLIMATHMCAQEPTRELLDEAERIVGNLALLPGHGG